MFGTTESKRGDRSWRDVAVFIGGAAVCMGDMEFASRALGVSYGSMRRYASKKEICGVEVVRLPDIWRIDGVGKPVTTEQAAALLDCDVGDVRRKANSAGVSRVKRARWANWSIPPSEIDKIRKLEKRRRLARISKGNARPAKPGRLEVVYNVDNRSAGASTSLLPA